MTRSPVRDLFPGLANVVYLNTAAMAVGAIPVRAAYEKALAEWSDGRFDNAEAERAGETARQMFARLIGAAAPEVAMLPTVAISVRSGRLRISVHFYNSVEDLDILANLLAASATTGSTIT